MRDARLLVADDDAELCSLLAEYLAEAGFEADYETNGQRAYARAKAMPYDLLILDVCLPGCDGFEVLRKLRVTSQIPVLMLTGRDSRADRVRGFDLGADDYVVKPFDPVELIGRVRAILRRASGLAGTARSTLQVGALKLNPGTRAAFYAGRDLGLTSMECEILEELMRNCGRVVSRDALCERLYQRPQSIYDRSIDTHVSRIRRKIGAPDEFIVSVRGTGYQLCSPRRNEISERPEGLDDQPIQHP